MTARLLRPGRVATVAAILLLLAIGTDSALADTSAYTEPPYTKTTGNNAFWFGWQAVNGVGSSGVDYRYYLCINTYRDTGSGSQQVEFSNGTNGPGSTNCTGSLRSGPSPSTGNNAFQPFSSSTVLQDGAFYQLCVTGYRFEAVGFFSDNSSCAQTTVDRNKPAITAGVDGSATYTRDPTLNLHIGYQDATSPPWNGSNSRASNWICFNKGSACTPTGQPDANCSVPNQGFGSRTNSFDCQASVGNQGDGQWYFCAYSADSAIPDNTAGTNQLYYGVSSNANLSTTQCGYVTLDRVAPNVTASSSATTVTAGDVVSFSASANDAVSGVSGQYSWTWGDNTAGGSGATTSHTYAQPGTYVAHVTTTDGAGNTGEATKTITVNAAPGGGTTGGGTTGGGTTGGGTTGGGTTGGGTASTTPGTSEGTTGATPTTQQLTPTTVSQQNGGGGAQATTVAGLSVVAPKTLKLAKAKSVTLALTPNSAGAAQVTLVKGSKIVASKGAKFGAAATYSLKLKLPRKLKAGAYTLRIAFTPTGQTKAVTKALKLKIVAAKKAKKHGKRVAKPVGIRAAAHPGKPDLSSRKVIAVR